MVGLVGVMCFCALFGSLQGSAIPMWEYLSRPEKTSFIYSLFANQVERFCDNSVIPSCNRQLLKYGLGTLRNLSDEQLDAMDPYQRGANNIIWEALMEGHRFQKTTVRPKTRSTTGKPNSYEDESFSDYDDFGAQSAASAKIDNIYVLPPPKDFVPSVDAGKSSYLDETREIHESTGSSILNILKKPEGKGVFTRFQNQYRPVDVTTEKIATSTEKPLFNGENEFISIPLTGPMVVRVYPDGTPVRESTQTPQDEDLRQYKLQHIKIPDF